MAQCSRARHRDFHSSLGVNHHAAAAAAATAAAAGPPTPGAGAGTPALDDFAFQHVAVGEPDELEALPGSAAGRVVDVAAGGQHSLALTSTGQVYAWGDNSRGQLGLGPGRAASSRVEDEPTRVATLRGLAIAEVGAGAAHSFFVARVGTVLACGCGAQGQLGVVHQFLPVGDIADQATPQRVDLPGRDDDV